ncbi:MAG: hypothetical protein Q7V05_10150 [Methanoregula sp.]|nr:hypothetical protein [Methanoregula sp.]
MTTSQDSAPDSAYVQENILVENAAQALDERRDAGLEGLVGGLDSAIIATGTDHLVPAVYELLCYTGLACFDGFFTRSNVEKLTEATAKQ